MVVTTRDAVHAPTEVKIVILSYPSITQIMVDSHCEILWANNYGAYLGHHPIANYAVRLDESEKQAKIYQQRLRSKMLGILINNSLTTDSKCKLRVFNPEYASNAQYNGAEMFFVIVKMV